MLNLYVVGISLAIILLSWYYFYSYYSERYIKFRQSFFDSNSNITLLCNPKEIIIINQTGLDFFGFNSLSSLKASYSDISNFFSKDQGCVDKYTYGKDWITKVYNDPKVKNNTIKVKIFSKEDAFEYYFHIKISKMLKNNEYLLSFNDITQLEGEKCRIQKSAELDPLTQIYNRVKLNELFEGIFFHTKKHERALTMILFDIDHFKKINDTFGHNVGDSVLKELSGLIRGLLREGDIFARWGGEEFVVLLQNTSLENSSMLASRLRKEIEKFSFDTVERITCSFGVTEFTQGDSQGLFFERVDEALYEAKRLGRNQVVVKK